MGSLGLDSSRSLDESSGEIEKRTDGSSPCSQDSCTSQFQLQSGRSPTCTSNTFMCIAETVLSRTADEGTSSSSHGSSAVAGDISNVDNLCTLHLRGSIRQDPRTTAFMQWLPTDVPVVSQADLVYVPDCCTWRSGSVLLTVVSYKSRTYALKEIDARTRLSKLHFLGRKWFQVKC
eukprot:jgi/Botrbrau1/11955/Bobra.341_1s0020.1